MTEYWYNTRTNQVEKGMQSVPTELIGPFKTISEAEKPWDRIRQRSAAWAADEAAEDDWGVPAADLESNSDAPDDADAPPAQE